MKQINNKNVSVVAPIILSKKLWMSCLLVFLISWISAFFLWYQNGWDKAILFLLNNANFKEEFVVLNQVVSRYGMGIIVIVYIFYLIISLKNKFQPNKYRIFLIIIFSFGIATTSGALLKEIFNRSRPLQEYANELRFLTNSGSPSFPSGHATKTTALILPFFFFSEFKNKYTQFVNYFLFLTAILIYFARILLGAHYLSDVLAGIGCAFFTLPIAVLISNQIFKKMTVEKFKRAIKIWIFVYLGLLYFLVTI